MKILILSDFFDDIGGAIGIAKTLAYKLKLFGHDVGFITTVKEKNLAGKSNIEGIDVYSIYSNYDLFWRPYLSLYNLRVAGKVKKIVSELKPDVVHAHNIHTHISYYSLKVAKKAGAKVFLTAHDAQPFHYGKLTEFIDPKDLSCRENFNYRISIRQQIKRAGKTYNPLRNLIIRYYLKKYVDKIFAVSYALKKALNDNGIGNVEVVHNGINTADWQVSEIVIKNFREKYGLKGKKAILFGTRLSEAKGSKEIILAIKEIIKKAPETVLLVVGKINEESRKILNFAREKEIEKNIVSTGWLSGDFLKAAYHACDAVAVPSICFDSFPTVNLEAMACRKPVIVTCFGGSREAVVDGETGYIINPFNIKELAEKIIYLLKNPEIAKKFSEAGYERVKKEFNLDKMVNDYLSWYNKVF